MAVSLSLIVFRLLHAVLRLILLIMRMYRHLRCALEDVRNPKSLSEMRLVRQGVECYHTPLSNAR